jgi:hypothetical protein
MRTLRAVLLAAIALSGAWLGAGAAHAAVPTQDSVRAAGDAPSAVMGGFFNLDFAVQSDPTGGNVSGHASFNLGSRTGLLVEGPVTCLAVDGNTAYVAIDSSEFPGSPVVAKLVDGGGPGSGLDRFDAFLSNGTSTKCGFQPFNENAVVAGDVVVVDAPPLPTSKDQCKQGGWRTFGFKNQGQCVASVQRGPKP